MTKCEWSSGSERATEGDSNGAGLRTQFSPLSRSPEQLHVITAQR